MPSSSSGCRWRPAATPSLSGSVHVGRRIVSRYYKLCCSELGGCDSCLCLLCRQMLERLAFGCPQRCPAAFRAARWPTRSHNRCPLVSQSVRCARRDFALSAVWAGTPPGRRGTTHPFSAAAHRPRRGEASSQRRSGSRFTRHEGGLPQRAQAPAGCPTRHYGPQEGSAPRKMRSSSSRPSSRPSNSYKPTPTQAGLKNTGTTLNYIADGTGIRDNIPQPAAVASAAAARRPSESRELGVGGRAEAQGEFTKGVQVTNLLQLQAPAARGPAVSAHATPPLLPG